MKHFGIGQRAAFAFDAEWGIESIERALSYLEDFLPHARDQAFLRKRQELKVNQYLPEQDDIQAELDFMETEWGCRFPAYFYGSLLVLLWSEVESVIERFAAEVKANKEISLAFKDVSGASIYGRLRKYIHAILGVLLPENSVIEDLQFLRNLYAHHGGDLSSQTKNQRKRIEAISRAQAGVSQTGTYLLINGAYLRNAMTSALELYAVLLEAHPSTEPDLVEL